MLESSTPNRPPHPLWRRPGAGGTCVARDADGLTSEAAGGEPASLRRAAETTWRALSPQARALLAQCSVFRGTFGVEAAEAVVEIPSTDASAPVTGAPWIVQLLQGLVDRSLVRCCADEAGAPRFSLSPCVRELAVEKLPDLPGLGALHARHARYYLHAAAIRVAELDGPAAHQALAWLATESDNLSAVHARATTPGSPGALPPSEGLRAATALAHLVASRGPLDWGLGVVEDALASVDDTCSDELLADVLCAWAALLRISGRGEEALGACGLARRRVEGSGNPKLTAPVLEELGRTEHALRRLPEARASLDAAVEQRRAIGDARGEARVLGLLAAVLLDDDELDEARRRIIEALAIHDAAGNPSERAALTSSLAMVEAELGETRSARRHYEDALRLHRELDDPRGAAGALLGLALLDQEHGLIDGAKHGYEAALEIARAGASPAQEGQVLGHLGTCLHEMGDIDAAVASFEAAIACIDAAASPGRAALWRACLAAVHATEDDAAGAADLFDKAEADLAISRGRLHLADAIWIHRGHLDLALARVAAQVGNTAVAAVHRRSARDRLERSLALPRRPADVRYAIKLLREAIADEPAALARARGGASRSGVLSIAANGSSFRSPGHEDVSLAARKNLQRILLELVRRRRSAPGAPVEYGDLIRAGWPEETLRPDVAANRLRVAIATLRRLGLAAALVTRSGGYLLDPRVPIDSSRRAKHA